MFKTSAKISWLTFKQNVCQTAIPAFESVFHRIVKKLQKNWQFYCANFDIEKTGFVLIVLPEAIDKPWPVN